MTPADEELKRAIALTASVPFRGRVWRVHWREIAGDDWSLSLRTSGRYHRGLDLFPPSQAFGVLYTSLAPETAIWEMVRRSAARSLAYLKNNVLTELEIKLDHVLDVAELTSIGLTDADFTGADFRSCQQIAAVARSQQLDGVLVPSAALPGCNLVVFPDNLTEAANLRLVQSTPLPLDLGDGQHRITESRWEP